MDSRKIGELILRLRREKGLTQQDLANALYLSDKTISKWERGAGCPDVTLLNKISRYFDVNIESILSGDLSPNVIDGGNMKRLQFYVCPECHAIVHNTGKAEITCCGRKLKALTAQPNNEDHRIRVEEIEYDYYINFAHEMTKTHYISFCAYLSSDSLLLVKLYPEQDAAVRFPQMRGGTFYFYCNQHGLMMAKI